MSDLMFRPVSSSAELDAVYRLTHDVYVEHKYCQPTSDGRLIHYPHLDNIPETTVLIALVDGSIVGTNSLTLDGPQGLHVDDDFKAECDLIRLEKRKLGASWRIVTRGDLRNKRKIVIGLITETVQQSLAHELTTCLFTFHPKHERLYKRILNMQTIASRENIGVLSNAPAVLMRLDFEALPDWCLFPDLN